MKRSATIGVVAGLAAVLTLGTAGVVVAQDTAPTGRQNVLSQLVKDGTINQQQAEKIIAAFKAQRGVNKEQRQARRAEMNKVVTDTLGISQDQLRQELKSGKTLAQIAGDKKDALVKAMTAKINERIDQAVSQGKITAEQATKIKAKVATRLDERLNRVHKAGDKKAAAQQQTG